MAKTNTSPLSGTRDFLPLDVLRRKYVVDIVERVYQRHGFEPLETPTMERLETLLGKYGDEGDQLIFRVMKRGDKLERTLASDPTENAIADSGLRYDLTVPLARVAAEYQALLPRIFKRYQIQPVFRADRPAKGRFREFFQCDLDVVGSTSPVVETEVLDAAAELLEALGFGTADFLLRLNHRAVLKALMETAGVPVELEESALVAVDKLDKIGKEGVESELRERGVPVAAVTQLIELLDTAPGSNAEILAWLNSIFEAESFGAAALGELRQILEYCSSSSAGRYLKLDPYLARGLSYYTGPIFEVVFEGFPGSAGGGGRYDNLIGMFSGQNVPACGFSLGLERVLMILEERKLFPERLAGQPQILMTLFSDETVKASLDLARSLREAGIRVDVYPEASKYGKQFKYADQRGIRFALLLSPREIGAGIVIAKDLITGKQDEVAPTGIPSWLEEHENR